MEDIIKRIDPFDGKPFVARRRNQIFRSARNRILWHNLQAAKRRDLTEKILQQIVRNWKVLCEQIQEGEKRTIPLNTLYEKGYMLNALTHLEEWEGEIRMANTDFIILNTDKKKNEITVYRKKQQNV